MSPSYVRWRDTKHGKGAVAKYPTCRNPNCEIYWCPTSEDWECMVHGGFDVCCDDPKCPSWNRMRRR